MKVNSFKGKADFLRKKKLATVFGSVATYHNIEIK